MRFLPLFLLFHIGFTYAQVKVEVSNAKEELNLEEGLSSEIQVYKGEGESYYEWEPLEINGFPLVAVYSVQLKGIPKQDLEILKDKISFQRAHDFCKYNGHMKALNFKIIDVSFSKMVKITVAKGIEFTNAKMAEKGGFWGGTISNYAFHSIACLKAEKKAINDSSRGTSKDVSPGQGNNTSQSNNASEQ